MTKYTSLAIALTATTFLSAPAIAASLTPTLEENSVFAYSEGSENDYNFTLQEADADGQLSTKYYKIDLKPEQFTTSKSISWTEVDADQKDTADVVEVKLPNDQAKYFKYTYTQPEGYDLTKLTYENRQMSYFDNAVPENYIISAVQIANSEGHYNDINNITYQDNNYIFQGSGSPSTNIRYHLQAGVVYNRGEMAHINADFIGNYIAVNKANNPSYYPSVSVRLKGGAIFNSGNINEINGNFIGNYLSASENYNINIEGYGGAIYNEGTIGKIAGAFIGNYVDSVISYGDAIFNAENATIDSIEADFIGNYNTSSGYCLGTIYNEGTINSISGNFIQNVRPIYSEGTIGDVTGNFIGNAQGAMSGEFGNVTGDFIKNYNSSRGGAINGTVKNLTGNFIGNYTISSGGGALEVNADNITGNFIGNYTISSGGGAIVLISGYINNITANFLNNYVDNGQADYLYGGAIDAWTYQTKKDSPIMISSRGQDLFLSGNYTKDIIRGKIYNAIHLNVGYDMWQNDSVLVFNSTDGGSITINDNIVASNPMFREGMIGGEFGEYDRHFFLTLTGNDVIDTSTGTTTQYVAMNNDIVNAGEVTVSGTTLRFGSYQHEDQTAKNWDGKGAFVASLNADGTANRDADAVTNLVLNNGVFDIANGYLETVKLKGYSATNSFLHIDVDVENMKADELHIAGNVEGVTKLVLYPTSEKDIRGESILFAQSENDTTGNADSFKVWRVYRSPYMFEVEHVATGENANQWSLTMGDEENEYAGVKPGERPQPDVPDVPTPELPDIPSIKPQPLPGSDRPVAPEVIGAESLPAAALAQTTNMIYNIMQKVSSNRFYCPGCGFYDYYWNGEAFHNLWANAVYNTLRIKTPTDIDAEVWGIEAGGDLQHDLNNKLGLFLSYRKGNYDMNGDGKHHYSTIGSEIDIDSYLAGLYYRYDRNNWWGFATVYGGMQKADLKTKDGIKSDTDGVEFGGSVELGYDYAVNKTVYLTPSVGAFYTQVDYDDAKDSAGKVAKYNTLRQLELEAGIKLTKAFVMDEGYANVYVKPSVVQTLNNGDEVRITGLGKVNTVDDQTLGRIEIGGRYGFTEQLSAYGWANHTFGDDYKASTVGLGLSYSW